MFLTKIANTFCYSGKVALFTKESKSYCLDLCINEEVLYAVGGNPWLTLVNISDPEKPVEMGWYNKSDYAQGIWVEDDLIFVADGYNGFVILQHQEGNILRELSRGSQVNDIYEDDDTLGYANDIWVSGSYMYLADGYDGLEIYNITDLLNPYRVVQYQTDNVYTSAMYPQGSILYLVNEQHGIELLNISDPLNPSRIGYYDDPHDSISDVWISGLVGFASGYAGFLEILNVTNPTQPERIHLLDLKESAALDICVAGHTAFIATGYGGLVSVDITDPNNPLRNGKYNDGGYAYAVISHQQYILLADGEDGIEIFDTRENLSSGYYFLPWITNGLLILDGSLMVLVALYVFLHEIFTKNFDLP